MTNKRYFTVVSRDTEQQVQAYLYGHTTIVSVVVSDDFGGAWGERTHLLLCTTSDTNPEYLAQSQADRLTSGLHHAGPVFDTEEEATQRHADLHNVQLPVQEAQARASNRRYEVLQDQRDHIEALRRQLRSAQAVLVEMEHADLHNVQL